MVHKVTFVIDNQTPFTLLPVGQYVRWGESDSGPQIVNPYASGSGGVLQASWAPLVGSAGMSGYYIDDNLLKMRIYVFLLGSDPNDSPEPNRARVYVAATPTSLDGATYDSVFSGQTSATWPAGSHILTISSSIGSADDCTATFVFNWSEN